MSNLISCYYITTQHFYLIRPCYLINGERRNKKFHLVIFISPLKKKTRNTEDVAFEFSGNAWERQLVTSERAWQAAANLVSFSWSPTAPFRAAHLPGWARGLPHWAVSSTAQQRCRWGAGALCTILNNLSPINYKQSTPSRQVVRDLKGT